MTVGFLFICFGIKTNFKIYDQKRKDEVNSILYETLWCFSCISIKGKLKIKFVMNVDIYIVSFDFLYTKKKKFTIATEIICEHEQKN